jgi:NAD(P)H dehydrogenase (quinone)
VLPFFEPDGERVLVGQQVYGLPDVPEHLVVVGSGATGAEFAHAFKRFGAEVTLVSSRDLILPTEDPDAAQVIEDVFERRGMTILRKPGGLVLNASGTRSSSGSRTARRWWAATCCSPSGRSRPPTDLGARERGVEVNAWGGIDVDAVGSRTSSPLGVRRR